MKDQLVNNQPVNNQATGGMDGNRSGGLYQWDKAYVGIARLKKLDLDDDKETSRLNKILFDNLPGLQYYSIWSNVTNTAIDEPGKRFVQISSCFRDKTKNDQILDVKSQQFIDFVFGDQDDLTYNMLLKEAIEKFKGSGEDKSLIGHIRINGGTYKAIHMEWPKILFDHGQEYDLYFVPLTEVADTRDDHVARDDQEIRIVSILTYFFEINESLQPFHSEKVEIISRLIYEKTKIGHVIKIERLMARVHRIASENFEKIDDFIRLIEIELLKAIPSEAIDIWRITPGRIESYVLISSNPSETVRKSFGNDVLSGIRDNCLIGEHVYSGFSFTTPEGIERRCKACMAALHLERLGLKMNSCMIIRATDLINPYKAFILFYNRVHNKRVKTFSTYETMYMEEVAQDIGILLGMYELWERKEQLKSALPHEVMSPIGDLLMGVNSVDYLIGSFLDSQPDKGSPDKYDKLAQAKISIDSLKYLIENIKNSFDNYIRFKTKDCSNVVKTQMALKDTLAGVESNYSFDFQKGKYIYVHSECEPIVAEVNKSMIYAVFNNVFKNARNYSHEYSVFKINGKNQNGLAIITFTNYGIGIEKDEIDLVFNFNYRGKELAKDDYGFMRGQGIGLALSRFFVSNCHGGRIFFSKSVHVADYNPFYLFMIRKLSTDPNVLRLTDNLEVPDFVKDYFNDPNIAGFFSTSIEPDLITPLSVDQYLFRKTFENELVVVLRT
ncbi:MAG: HAMP domain-containing histidine kinase [Nitrospirae bacterium]|nr:HAMP domain-containing histidine kinase [Nitrospirota bacterium]